MASNVKSMTIDIKDYSKNVLSDLEKKINNALEACGMEAARIAAEDCPVDTGRLRNSITYATATAQGDANTHKGQAADPEEYKVKGTPEKNAVYIGTNVIYAPAVEYLSMQHKSGKAHFLRDALANHRATYEEIIKKALKA